MQGRLSALGIGAAFVLAVVSCRAVLGLEDPEPYGPDGSTGTNPNGETPVVTQDAAACGNANLVTDPKHCGRCGHDCRGGRCERGRCLPNAMATSSSEVFAVHDGSVYGVEGSLIFRSDAPQGPRVQIAAASVGNPRSILASNAHIVWSGDTTGVRVCARTGCGADDPVQLSAPGKNTGPLVELPTLNLLYPYQWANYTDSTVERGADPGAPTVLSTNTRVVDNPCTPRFAAIADAGALIYDTPAKHFLFYPATASVARDAGAAETQCAITANGTSVFYTDTNTIWRSLLLPDGTLAPRAPVAQNLGAPRVLAADDDHVYWAASTPETDVVRCRVTGCDGAPEILAEAIPSVRSMVVDGDFLYFAVFLNEALGYVIYRIPK